MTRATWNSLVAVMWLSLPAVALNYWLVWEQLPARLATHFDGAGRPNGWMSPQGTLIFGLTFLTIILILATVVLTRVRRPGPFHATLLGLFAVIVASFTYTEYATLRFNLHGTPINFAAVIVPVVVAALLLAVVFLVTKRGIDLPVTSILASEVHASQMWGLVIAAPGAIVVAATASIPNVGLRLTLGAAGVAMLGAAAMAWSGFRYIFTKSGLEIRTLGFRLRSIPREQIKDYSVGEWNLTGGYGIRGIGDRRAYVWGNKGVRIKTLQGEVFLGHNDPVRIVHDLDVMKKSAH